MISKKEYILENALTLFATEGYSSTSTSKVAKHAKVSEGLIFRHFKNKEGLLEAVLQQGHEKAKVLFEKFNDLADPKEIIKAFVNLPFSIPETEKPFWKLLYTLKWQTDKYESDITKTTELLLEGAFRELGYENPAAEARLILLLVDGVAMTILLKSPADLESIRTSIFEKYQLQ